MIFIEKIRNSIGDGNVTKLALLFRDFSTFFDKMDIYILRYFILINESHKCKFWKKIHTIDQKYCKTHTYNIKAIKYCLNCIPEPRSLFLFRARSTNAKQRTDPSNDAIKVDKKGSAIT
jgi:hypothetical protein